MIRTLLVLAHIDDETIGAASELMRYPGQVRILYATDSAPRDSKFWSAAYPSREAYRDTRRAELQQALEVAGCSPKIVDYLDIADQEAVVQLSAVVEAIQNAIEQYRPRMILTHAYEGGHPDHDAVAFAARYAVDATPESLRPQLSEATYYHAFGGPIVVGEFVPAPDSPEILHIPLGEEELTRKQHMYNCFQSQQHVLDRFREIRTEAWRRAPLYDFLRPPHPGILYYESGRLGWTRADWETALADSQLLAR